MIYGDLSFRERLFRAAIGAVFGGGAAFLLMLRNDMFGGPIKHSQSTWLLPATCVGAALGALLAFRVKRI